MEDYEEENEFEPEPEMGEGSGPALPESEMRIELATRILRNAKESIEHAMDLLSGGDEMKARKALVDLLSQGADDSKDYDKLQAQRVVEGVFNGEQMIGSDGKEYVVPSNYASKSRLVEGDIMKLTIRKDGTHVYKQLGPMERRRLSARLAWDASASSYVVIADDRIWKVLNASITFYKGQEGDSVTILIPKNTPSTWAAVENVVRE